MRGVCLALVAALCGCDGADPDPGLDLSLRVPGAQVRSGPVRASEGPAITQLEVRTPTVRPGQGDYLLAGRVAAAAAAVHVGRVGDDGHFVVPTGVPDPAVEGELQWSLRFDLSPTVAPGPLQVRLVAVDAAGRPGPAMTAELTVGPAVPAGDLVVRLSWDAVADLDLYVVDPAGNRLGPDDPNTWRAPPPGAPPAPPDAWRTGGILDRDAGADCDPAGVMAEHAVWATAAPAGTYAVGLDVASMCGQTAVGWRVEVWRGDARLTEAAGVAWPEDARVGAAAGAPPLAVTTFEVR